MALYFKIQLDEVVKPQLWRKIMVPESISMLKFHKVIQAAFGWQGYHLFEFFLPGHDDDPIGIPNEVFPDIRNATRIPLKSVFTEVGQEYKYVYDFGDDWMHSVVLERITPEQIRKADCIAGRGTCPPEDCGGVAGFERVKKIQANTRNRDLQELREWLGLAAGEVWDADAFDLEEASERVRVVVR